LILKLKKVESGLIVVQLEWVHVPGVKLWGLFEWGLSLVWVFRCKLYPERGDLQCMSDVWVLVWVWCFICLLKVVAHQ
jgi:hypothetical protein